MIYLTGLLKEVGLRVEDVCYVQIGIEIANVGFLSSLFWYFLFRNWMYPLLKARGCLIHDFFYICEGLQPASPPPSKLGELWTWLNSNPCIRKLSCQKRAGNTLCPWLVAGLPFLGSKPWNPTSVTPCFNLCVRPVNFCTKAVWIQYTQVMCKETAGCGCACVRSHKFLYVWQLWKLLHNPLSDCVSKLSYRLYLFVLFLLPKELLRCRSFSSSACI